MELTKIFSEFVDVIQENEHFDIGLLDLHGIVLECSNESEIGTQKNMSPSTTDFYHDIVISNQKIGCFWVHSNDENLKLVAHLLADSLDTRIEAELNDDELRSNMTKDDQLIKYLLNEENFQTEKILRLVDEMQLDSVAKRVAIYIHWKEKMNFDDILLSLKIQNSSDELIVSAIDSKSLLFFQRVSSKLSDELMREYFQEYKLKLQQLGIRNCYIVVGSIQSKFKNYADSYKHSQWVYQNKKLEKDTVYFFNDFVMGYFVSFLDLEAVATVYDNYDWRDKQADQDEIIELADALIQVDFKLSQAAAKLFLHKNTLIYKLHKYEKIFHIDIRGSFQGKCTFCLIAKVFKERKRNKQVGIET